MISRYQYLLKCVEPIFNCRSIDMADVHSKEARSYNMSRVRSKDTKPEMLVRKFLFSKGYRYRLHDKKLPGKPDIVLPKFRTVIFINGCFWHGHNDCRYYTVPKTRTEWWINKIAVNKTKDSDALGLLKILGWNTIIVWGCELKTKNRDITFAELLSSLSADKNMK